jgi:hypothetical protein
MVVFLASRVVVSVADPRQLLGLRGVPVENSGLKDEESLSSRFEKTPEKNDVLAGNLTVPLHAHSGTHHVHVYIGSPPQRQTLILDTGSRVMAFPCKPCRSCGNHASPYYDPAKSTTQRMSKCGNCLLEGISTCSLYGEQCIISQKYTEGSSWSANEVEDMVWLGTSDVVESIENHMQLAIPYAFGCQTSIKGLFQKQYADGILGLARHETSLVAAYHKADVIRQNAFSLCLTLDAGYLSLGGSMPTQHHHEAMRMTPITREHGWYSVEITRILVGAIEVTSSETHVSLLKTVNSGKGCILDSGTTDTYLPASLAKKFGKAAMLWTDGLTDFSERSQQKKYSFAEFERLPELSFIMANNVTLTMQPRNYMEGITLDFSGQVQGWNGTKSLTNRVYLEETEGAVLGANAMFGYDILFDAQNHKVGIAKADCAATVHSTVAL